MTEFWLIRNPSAADTVAVAVEPERVIPVMETAVKPYPSTRQAFNSLIKEFLVPTSGGAFWSVDLKI